MYAGTGFTGSRTASNALESNFSSVQLCFDLKIFLPLFLPFPIHVLQDRMGDPYTFVKVEDFFSSSTTWPILDKVVSHQYDPETYTLTLNLQKSSDPSDTCVMQLLFLQQNLFRVRINPGKLSPDEFTRANTRTIVQDTLDDLRRILEEGLPFEVDYRPPTNAGDPVVLVTRPLTAPGSSTTVENSTRPNMWVYIDLQPLRISVWDSNARPPAFPHNPPPNLLWSTATPGIKYQRLGNEDFSIIQVGSR
jgi:hypothetical protein